MVKIYSAGKIVSLARSEDVCPTRENTLLANVQSAAELQLAYNELISKNNLHEICFFSEDEVALYEFFSSMFTVVKAAGGLVKNSKNEYLFIFRHGKWDLPKGKIEKNEKIEDAAIREVEEECGLSGVSITRELYPTYHTYELNGKKILKPTYWFEMTIDNDRIPSPQLEEGITEVRWFPASALGIVRANTHQSILDVIRDL